MTTITDIMQVFHYLMGGPSLRILILSKNFKLPHFFFLSLSCFQMISQITQTGKIWQILWQFVQIRFSFCYSLYSLSFLWLAVGIKLCPCSLDLISFCCNSARYSFLAGIAERPLYLQPILHTVCTKAVRAAEDMLWVETSAYSCVQLT